MRKNKIQNASYLIIIATFGFLLYFKLMWGFIFGVSTFLILTSFYNYFSYKVDRKVAHKLTVFLLLIITTFLILSIVFTSYSIFHYSVNAVNNFLTDFLSIIHQFKNYIPESYREYLPDDIVELKSTMVSTISANKSNVMIATTNFFKGFAHSLVGIIIGAVISFSFFYEGSASLGPLNQEILNRLRTFSAVFKNVIGAQVKISLLNTALTSLYLFIIIPILGFHFPYAKTLIVFTFIFGLLPVVGNLITNTMITVMGLSVSFEVALFSIVFLVVIHKLEYYFNAKIIGNKINTKIWELLIAMVIFETLFGLTGLALAPIFYGYIKEELKLLKLI